MKIRIPALRGLGGGVWAAMVACSMASTALAQPAETTPFSEKAAAAPFQKDVTTMNTSFGGSMNSGNTQATSVSLGSAFAIVRGRHGLGLTMDFAYGRARVTDVLTMRSRMVDTVRNMRARGRYDLFLTPLDALFLAGGYRWDPFAGLDMRNEGMLGYKRFLHKEEKQLLWAELGYDLTYDNYDPDPLPDPTMPGHYLKGHEWVHAARLFLGYDHHLYEQIQLVTGVEGLLSVTEPKDFRFNWDLAIRSSIMTRLQLELKFSLQFDNVPVPGKKSVDALTRANLIYTLI
jgi:putative salt-induced outer membrane protein YdiY